MNNIGKPKKTPLYDVHLNNNAKVVNFSGWLLPVQFAGILKEHNHTREYNSIFDICHMGEFLIEGNNAEKDLSGILTTDVIHMHTGSCKYGFILNENAGFIDDTILYKFSNNKYMLVVNASRKDIDFSWIGGRISEDTILTDISEKTAKIDLQGPLSAQSASIIFPEFEFHKLKRFCFSQYKYKGHDIIISATGYTGEKGFEFYIPASLAAEIWELLLSVESVLPAGLGARDSLRLEKGFSLYGHDIDENINPYEAGLEKFLTAGKLHVGSDSLKKIAAEKISRKLVPFLCEGRRSARDGYEVFAGDKKIGLVTSGAFSPTLKRGIGLCLIDSDYAVEGNSVICKNKNIEINGKITKLPFI